MCIRYMATATSDAKICELQRALAASQNNVSRLEHELSQAKAAIAAERARPRTPRSAPTPAPLPPGIKSPPHIVSLLIDDLGFDDLRSHGLKPGSPSFSPTVASLLKGGVLAVGHHGEAAAPAGHTVDLSSYVLGDTLAAVPHFTCFILLLQMATR